MDDALSVGICQYPEQRAYLTSPFETQHIQRVTKNQQVTKLFLLKDLTVVPTLVCDFFSLLFILRAPILVSELFLFIVNNILFFLNR